jgi:inner membrane protein
MQAPTHATFGLVFTIAAGTVAGVVLTPAVAGFAVLGALLPDVDTPTSGIGTVLRPLARRLERRFGHRTVTHSVLGLAVATALLAPLALVDRRWPLAFALGYASHLLLDCANKAGIPLWYPSPVRAVLPRREAWRIAVGSRAETGLCAGFLVALVILAPLQQLGFARALHALTRTTPGAIADYRAWEGQREVWVDVAGTLRLAQRRVRQRYRVLGLANANTLIVLDPATDAILTVGPGETTTIHPHQVRAHPGRPITVQTRAVALSQQLLRDLLAHVPPTGETYLHGTVRTPDAPPIRPDPERYAVLTPGLQALELRFARPGDLADPGLGTLFVVSGLVLVQTITPAAAAAAPAPPPPTPAYDDITELFIAHLTDPSRELLVREGDRVHQGQLLARLTWKDPELARQRQQAEAERLAREAALALQEAKAREVQALVAAQLAAPWAAAREDAALLRAQAAVAQTRRELDRLADEARRAVEVRAPVDGQVLTVRVHVIHGSEGTAALRLLYRRRPPGPATPSA